MGLVNTSLQGVKVRLTAEETVITVILALLIVCNYSIYCITLLE